MASVEEGEGDARGDHHGAVVADVDELTKAEVSVDFCVERFDGWEAFLFAFFVEPFAVAFLDFCGVWEHDLTEVAGGEGGVDISVEAFFCEIGEVSCVVDVGVGKDDVVDVGGVEVGEAAVDFVGIKASALIESAVEEDFGAVNFEEVLRARGRASGAAEFDFHMWESLLVF